MKWSKFAKTRNRRNRKRSQKRRRTAVRRRRSQRGGGFSYEIPGSAIVRWRSLDDEGTQPPVLLLKSDADKAEEEMEHILS
jgi:hypothetical protein